MRKYYVYPILVLLIFIFSCRGKKEEVKIYKNSEIDSSGKLYSQPDSQNIKGNELSTASDEIVNIIPEEAKHYIDKKAIVKGYIAAVVIREKVAFLNFEKKFPANPMTGVVFAEKFSEFGDLNLYQNKNVEVSGVITLYQGKPEIILSNKNQIRILK